MLQHTDDLYAALREYRESRGLPFFEAIWDLNLYVMRDETVGTFEDRLFIACIDDAGEPVVFAAECSGDAWAGEWAQPTHPQGCIYTLDQHVPGGFVQGQHKGRNALVQARDFRYVRWPSRYGRVPTVDELEQLAKDGHAFEANRATNLHNRASARSPAVPQRDDTEGCTLVRHQHEYAAVMALVDQQLRYRGTSQVSPTFGKLRDLNL